MENDTRVTQFDSDGSLAPSRGTAVVEKISREIRNGSMRHGQRLLSIRDLAKQHNVSFGVARAAVGKLAEMGLVQKSRGSGTYVTYSQGKGCRMNGVYLMLNSKDHLYDHLTADLASYLHEDGFQAIKVARNKTLGLEQFSNMFNWWRQEPPRAIVTQWENPELDKAIMEHCGKSTRKIATFRLREGLPAGWSSVNSERGDAVRIAFEHLLTLGHKRFGLVMYGMDSPSGSKRILSSTARLHYRRMTHSAGRVLRSQASDTSFCIHHIKYDVETGDCDPFSESNYSRIKEWLSKEDRPTAIVGFQDSYIVAVKRAAEEIGLRVPEDVALIGIGNTPWAEAGDLSSVWMHEDIVARRIWELIVAEEEMFAGTSRHLVVEPELICRSSCGAGKK